MKIFKIFSLIVLSTVFLLASCQKKEAEHKTEMEMGEKHNFILKEIEEMHDYIHPLQHQALPNNDITAIKNGAPKLLEESRKILNAQLPENFKDKETTFKELSQKLVKSCEELNARIVNGTDEEVKSAYIVVHEDFESLVEILK
jgi:hypothetical protein